MCLLFSLASGTWAMSQSPGIEVALELAEPSSSRVRVSPVFVMQRAEVQDVLAEHPALGLAGPRQLDVASEPSRRGDDHLVAMAQVIGLS